METRVRASQDTNAHCNMCGYQRNNIHGKNVESAIEEIRKHLNNAKPSVYRIRIIHGYHGGTRIRDGIQEEFSYGREPKVKRITMGDNQGITELYTYHTGRRKTK